MGQFFHRPAIDVDIKAKSRCMSTCCDDNTEKCYCCVIIKLNKDKQIT